MIAQVRCKGITRAGQPCQITAASTMQDASGRHVAAPLRRGSPLCLFHARPFCTQLATVDGPVVILYLDLVPVLAAKIPSLVLHHVISLVEHVFESMGNHWR